MSTTSSSTLRGSNHWETGANLARRGIRYGFSSEGNKADEILFPKEWTAFAAAAGVAITADVAWTKFEPVMIGTHDGEDAFSLALFGALEQLLQPTSQVRKVTKTAAFALFGSTIGFARGVGWTAVGFPSHYDAAGGSIYDHSCVVFHGETKLPNPAGFSYRDVTATVELKMDDSNCEPFKVAHAPNLKKAHGALGQALLYILDVFHCLMRRGILVAFLPVVIIAGKRNPKKRKRTLRSHTLCCVEASLCIPKEPGYDFTYKVHNYLPFDTVQGEHSSAKKAIALYLRSMRSGIEYARLIENQQVEGRRLPRTLCCQNFEVPDRKLRASPIPDAFSSSDELRISPGELYLLRSLDTQWLSKIGNGGLVRVGGLPVRGELFLKVSNNTVHNHLVPQIHCWDALTRLNFCQHSSIAFLNWNPLAPFGFGESKQSIMESEIAKVLVAFARTSNTRTSYVVMKDLTTTHGPLHPKDLHRLGKMPALWSAFSSLVKNVLLPMAALEVIHLDIRPGWNTTYNILCNSSGSKIGLVLIDFESLIEQGKVMDDNNQNVSAVVVSCLPEPTSAVQYAWWQVLWMAKVWSSKLSDDSKHHFGEFFEMVRVRKDFPSLSLLANSCNVTASDVEDLLEFCIPIVTLYL